MRVPPVVGVLVRGAVLAFVIWQIWRLQLRGSAGGEPNLGEAAFALLLIAMTFFSGLVCAVIIVLRIAGMRASSWLFRRALYAFIVGHATIFPFWAVVLEEPNEFGWIGAVMAVCVVIVIAGSIWLRHRGQHPRQGLS